MKVLLLMNFHLLFRPEAKPPIPPDAKITYEIQLLAVRDGPNINTMSDEERMSIGYEYGCWFVFLTRHFTLRLSCHSAVHV